MAFELKEHPHRRFNPLTRQWILVSPHRNQRPWLGQVETVAGEVPRAYDPACYMCPGNTRAAGARNPDYKTTFAFDNDYPALLPDTPEGQLDVNSLLVARSESGICRVVCFSPRHDLTIARMSLEDASNPHPHCQIWASASVPDEPAKEQLAQQQYQTTRHSCLLCDYLKLERDRGERVVFENPHFSILVPFWAVWPFETLVVARGHIGALTEFTGDQNDALADALKRLTTRYDQLFQISFPYSTGFDQRPSDGQSHPEWHLHAHFYPPLLRSATVRKFMVGYEMLGTPQRDITTENAAARLREMKET